MFLNYDPFGWSPNLLLIALIAVIAYFMGCFNGAVIVSKYILKNDVRNHGSGNAGLTNFHRTFGGPLTFVVILTDMLKAVFAIWLAVWLTSQMGQIEFLPYAAVVAKYWAGLWCLLGHMFPCMFHFKGGKGILSGGTVALMIDWRIALIVWGGFLLLTVLTRYVSLGSVVAAAAFPFSSWLIYRNTLIIILGFVIGLLVLWMHRGNIKRLVSGTESKLSFKKKQ